MDEIIKIVAKYFIIIPILLAVYVLWRLDDKRERIRFILVLAIGGALSLLLARLSSHFISDPRPFVVGRFTPLLPHSADNGFPSDHTLLSAFLGFATLGYSKRLGLVALAVATSIGLARVAAGVHHLEDIIGSFIIAGVAAFMVGWAVRRWLPQRVTNGRRAGPPSDAAGQ